MENPPKPLLISFPTPFVGAQQTHCSLEGCGAIVYEHPENLEYVKTAGGQVICVFCGIKLKIINPNIVAEKQLWHGALRTPQLTAQTRELADWLMSKGKERNERP